MPITKSAKKALRVSDRKKSWNDSKKRALKDIIKKVEKTLKTNKEEALKLLPKAYAIIDKAAKRGVIKDNNASRKKSRLARILK